MDWKVQLSLFSGSAAAVQVRYTSNTLDFQFHYIAIGRGSYDVGVSPVRSYSPLGVVKIGDQLEINDVLLDFSRPAEGSTLPAEAVNCTFIVASVECINGDLVITLMLPQGADIPESARFPVDIQDP